MRLRLKKEIDFWIGGLALILLYPLIRFAAIILRRDHNLENPKHICFVKMLGGGNLLMVLPTVEALKQKYPQLKISLICSKGILGFAETFSVFDEIKVINDNSLIGLSFSSLSCLLWLFQNVETTVDLEVHSRLSTIFTTISLVKNRIGLLSQDSLWRTRFYTHSIYVNPYHAIYDYYDAIGTLFGVHSMNVAEAQRSFVRKIQALHVPPQVGPKPYFTFGVGCSDLALERMIPNAEWAELLKSLNRDFSEGTFVFLGASRDSQIVEKIFSLAPEVRARSVNLCGKLQLRDSIRLLLESQCFLGIDSALVHFARFCQIPSVSFWGPTRPEALLRPSAIPDLQISRKIACSPCVHFTEVPPCKGQNICNRHQASFPDVLRFLKNLSGASNTVSRRDAEIWISYPAEKMPRRIQMKIQYA